MKPNVILIMGALLFLGSLPLAFRLVPMNRIYGFRTAASRASDQAWYDINAVGGRCLALVALLVVALGFAGNYIPEQYREAYTRYSPAVAIGLAVLTFVGVGIWSRRYLP